MKKLSGRQQILIIIGIFIFSRFVFAALGIHFSMWPLAVYWQYLDLETLRHNLLAGIWYDHAQPPVFNLLLGIVLKWSGTNPAIVFALLLKCISLANACLLFYTIKKLTPLHWLPMIVAIVYLLSPGTVLFENELFYTSFISFLLLLAVFFLLRFTVSGTRTNALLFVLPLVVLCLTRSVYHIAWLLLISIVLVFHFRKKAAAPMLGACMLGVLLVGGWYLKNKIIFGKFNVSSWMGMNMARNVFHDNEITDSSCIEAYEPFSPISVYRKFVDPAFEQRFKGLNDRDLLQELKNDTLINENEVSYIPVSDLYQKASMVHIKAHPKAFAMNVAQSAILYFTPATVYSLSMKQAVHMRPYDIAYSFNLTHFASDKQQRRILLTISAMPKIILYLFVFFYLLRYAIRSRSITAWNLFIMITIGFVFGIGSLLEHYENMRFRFETEPLFLILAAQVFSRIYSRYEIRKSPPVRDLIA